MKETTEYEQQDVRNRELLHVFAVNQITCFAYVEIFRVQMLETEVLFMLDWANLDMLLTVNVI